MNSLERIKNFVDEMAIADEKLDIFCYVKELTERLHHRDCFYLANPGDRELFVNTFEISGNHQNGPGLIELQNNREDKLVIDHINGAPALTRWLAVNTENDETGEKQSEIFRLFQIVQRHLNEAVEIYRPGPRWVIIGFSPNARLNVMRSDLIPLTQLMVYRLQNILNETTHLMEDDQKLTPRELDCLHWFAEGKTSQEIGIILGISARTVNMHANSIIQKMDASNRINAVAKAIRLGLI